MRDERSVFQRNQGSRGRLHLQSLSPGAVVALLSAWPQVVVVRGHIKSISGNFWKQYIIKDTFRRTFSSCYSRKRPFVIIPLHRVEQTLSIAKDCETNPQDRAASRWVSQRLQEHWTLYCFIWWDVQP